MMVLDIPEELLWRVRSDDVRLLGDPDPAGATRDEEVGHPARFVPSGRRRIGGRQRLPEYPSRCGDRAYRQPRGEDDRAARADRFDHPPRSAVGIWCEDHPEHAERHVELALRDAQVTGVALQELDVEARFARARTGELEQSACRIHTGGQRPAASGREGGVARPAPDVQDPLAGRNSPSADDGLRDRLELPGDQRVVSVSPIQLHRAEYPIHQGLAAHRRDREHCTVRIGVRVPQYGSTWPELRDAALRIESLGFDGIWVNDHLQSPGRNKREATFDALTTLTALAPLTGRARLGVAVLSASYRPAPLAAKMTTILDVISEGRLILGLGTGSDRDEHAAYGVPFETPAERTRGLLAALDVIQTMRREPDGAMPNRPAASPPIWLAAHKPRLLRHAGERADGVISAWVPPEEFASRRAIAEEARLGADRPPIAYCLYTFALAYRSDEEAHGWLAAEAEALGSTPAGVLRWLRTTGIVGTIDEVRDRLAEYSRVGTTDAVLVLPSRVSPDAIDALAEAALAAPDVPPRRPAPRQDARANLVDLLVERHRRDRRGGDVAVIDDRGRWTFDELSDASARAAGRLRAAGVRRGERVAIVMPDSREWCAAFLGAARLGAVAIPLEPGGRHTVDTLIDLEAAAAVCGSSEELPSGLARIDPVELPTGAHLPIAPVHPEDLAYLIFSSGSTGRPKGAMHAHRDLLPSIEGYATAILALAPGDRCHSVASLFASLGFGNGFFRPLGLGATCVMSALRPTVRSVLDLVARHGITLLSGVPTFWSQLATFLERHPDPGALRGVRLAVSSGDALPAAVGNHLRSVTGVELIEGLGCSECSNIVISTRPGETMPGALGRLVPGVELRLAGDDGRPVPAGTPGRLWIKSPSNTTGYWRRSAETRELVYGPWIRMGDVLREDDGVYRHLGRSDDLFKVDAKWVSPVEVEAALHEHEAVADAAVVGRPDPVGLVRPVAFVVLAESAPDGPDLTEMLRRHVAHRLAPHMAPVSVTVLDELPRGATGKVDRRALRDDPLSESESARYPEAG